MGSLEELSARELHDQAVKLAVRRLDVSFLWTLAKEIPAAEAAGGHVGDADADVLKISALLNDLVHAGDGAVAESLRPLYLDYLTRHAEPGTQGTG